MADTNLQQVEKKVYRGFFEDGLFEIGLGYVFLCIGLNMIGNSSSFTIPVLILPILFLPKIKKKVVLPRAGHVKMSKKRKWNMGKAVAIIAGSVLINVLLALVVKTGVFLTNGSSLPWMSILISAKVLLVFTLMGYFLAYERLYIWAGLLALTFLAGESVIYNTGSRVGGGFIHATTGFIILIFGVLQLIRFLKNNQLPEEVSNV